MSKQEGKLAAERAAVSLATEVQQGFAAIEAKLASIQAAGLHAGQSQPYLPAPEALGLSIQKPHKQRKVANQPKPPTLKAEQVADNSNGGYVDSRGRFQAGQWQVSGMEVEFMSDSD